MPKSRKSDIIEIQNFYDLADMKVMNEILDINPKELYRSKLQELLKNYPHYWNLIYTVPDYIDGKYVSPDEEAPMQGGINIIPLNITDDSKYCTGIKLTI